MGDLERSLGAPERPSDGNGFVDWEELRAVASEPLVEVGGHSGSHAHLSSLSQEDARVEVLGSKQTLENALGVSVTSFAYPYGTEASYTEETVEILKEAGFSCGLTGVEQPPQRSSSSSGAESQPGLRPTGVRRDPLNANSLCP